jgi:hypothetical protein
MGQTVTTDHRHASNIGDILLVSQSITLPLSEDLRQTDLILFVPACLAIILEHAQVSFHLPSTIALLFVCLFQHPLLCHCQRFPPVICTLLQGAIAEVS